MENLEVSVQGLSVTGPQWDDSVVGGGGEL